MHHARACIPPKKEKKTFQATPRGLDMQDYSEQH